MKHILAENLLRFGVKNLSEATKKKLQEQTTTVNDPYSVNLQKINPEILGFLDRVHSANDPNKEYVELHGSHILQHKREGGSGTGYLNIYTVTPIGGIPVLHQLYQVIDRQKDPNTQTPQSIDDIMKSPNTQSTNTYKEAGNSVAEKLNNIWNTVDEYKTQLIINTAINYIKTNQSTFQTAFQKITRNIKAIDLYWKNDNPQQYKSSQYYLAIESKIKPPVATTILNLIRDTELINNIQFKVKNFRSNGSYPELKIPAAV